MAYISSLCFHITHHPIVAPLSTLEASLRLLYAFAECGPANDPLVNSDAVRQILHALHRSDVMLHPCSNVLMAYFDVAVRYVKQTGDQELLLAAGHMAGSGIRHVNLLVRCRSAHQLLKLIEGVESKTSGSAVALLPLVISMKGEELHIAVDIKSVDRTLA